MTQARRPLEEQSHQTCPLCGELREAHFRRCKQIHFDGEVKRCLLGRDHEGVHAFRESRRRRLQ